MTTTDTHWRKFDVKDCPPSAVAAAIVPWSEIREGDLVVWDGEFRLVTWISPVTDAEPLHIVLLADENNVIIPAGTYAAVRRYVEG